jgi:hypothetical protein
VARKTSPKSAMELPPAFIVQSTMMRMLLCLCTLLLYVSAPARAAAWTGAAAASEAAPVSVTVPFVLDHNRMLVDVEMQRTDGSWRTARLWVDTGEPSFSMSGDLARDLGIDTSALAYNSSIQLPGGVRIGGMPLDFTDIETHVSRTAWMFNALQNDAHVSSRVLARYDVVFDYPARLLTIAGPGTLAHRGVRAPAAVDPKTGIVQIDAVMDGDSLSFALDMGASYSLVDSSVVARLLERHPALPHMTGAAGCANMWGWWPPDEQNALVVRVPEIMWGPVRLSGVGLVAVSAVQPGGPTLGAWYSRKTARPVNGFLGPNAFKAYRVEIDYAGSAVYFEKGAGPEDATDMDLVGLTLRPENDGSYTVIGIVSKDGEPAVEGVEPGDKLLVVGDLEITGVTMGTAVDALRGRPGDVRILLLERDGTELTVEATVKRLL